MAIEFLIVVVLQLIIMIITNQVRRNLTEGTPDKDVVGYCKEGYKSLGCVARGCTGSVKRRKKLKGATG